MNIPQKQLEQMTKEHEERAKKALNAVKTLYFKNRAQLLQYCQILNDIKSNYIIYRHSNGGGEIKYTTPASVAE